MGGRAFIIKSFENRNYSDLPKQNNEYRNNSDKWGMELKLSTVLKREFKNKKLTEISNDTGISISLLSDWKEGRLPSAKNLGKLQKLADYLGLTLSQLLFSKKEMDSSAITLQSTQFRDGVNQYRIIIEKIE